jgi:multisubunit Na+/H+ antiporter MnhB subunit
MKNNKPLKLNSYLAIVFGLIIISTETYRRYGDFGHWSRWMDDYLIGLFLIIPAILVLKGHKFSISLLIAGWAFSSGLLYGSFFSKVIDVENIKQSNIPTATLIDLIGIALFVSVASLLWLLILEYKRLKKDNER